MKKFIPYLITFLATIGLVLLFIQNRDLKSDRQQIKHQKQEISLRLEDKEKEHERLNEKVSVLRDSLGVVNENLSQKNAREKILIRNYERRLHEVEKMTEIEVDSFLLANYPDDKDIVRDLVAFSHCREMLVNKDGTIKTLEVKVNLQNKVIISQDSIIANLQERIELKDEMIAKIEEGHKVDLKRVKRQRNVAYGIGGGMFLLAIAALL